MGGKNKQIEKLDAEFRLKNDIKNAHYEINRANKTMKSLLERIKELQAEVAGME